MEKKQYELFSSVLGLLHQSGALNDMVLIGSWCLPLYGLYFKPGTFVPSIRTRDIDLLIPAPGRESARVDIPKLLEPLGFMLTFKGRQGYHQLSHPDLIVEFLVPEKGRPALKPVKLKAYGINAQALRYLSILAAYLIVVRYQGIDVKVPHPATFALHKLIIAGRRKEREKRAKDVDAAAMLLGALMREGEEGKIRDTYSTYLGSWQKTVIKNIGYIADPDLRDRLISLLAR